MSFRFLPTFQTHTAGQARLFLGSRRFPGRTEIHLTERGTEYFWEKNILEEVALNDDIAVMLAHNRIVIILPNSGLLPPAGIV